MTDFHIVIPARYASSRFPGKPLAQINDKPMLEHVYAVAKRSSAASVTIATDDQRIYDAASTFCDSVLMTSDQHQSGTDRLAEVCQLKGWSDDEIVVNLQGDEPLTPPELLAQVARNLHDNPQASISTLTTPLVSPEDIEDANIVKVVSDHQGFAMYFSRAAIPFRRDVDDLSVIQYHRHLGIYGYRVSFLMQYHKLPACELENTEKLEQLRAMYYGHRIHTQQAMAMPGPGIDTPEDLERVEQLLADNAQ